MTKKNRIKFGIFYKVLMVMVLVAVLPLLTIWYVNYQAANDRIVQHTEVYFSEVLNRLTAFVDDWVEMNTRMLRQNARLPDMRSMEADRQNTVLKTMVEEYDWNYLAFTVAPDGQNIGRSDGKPVRNYGDRVYVQQVLSGQPLGKQVLIGKTSGKPAFVFAVPISGEAPGPQGVLAIAMTIADISNQIATARIGETGFAFLVDEQGKVIAHPSEELTNNRSSLKSHPAVAAALSGQRSVIYTNDAGVRMIAHMRTTGEGWSLIAEQEYDEAFAELDETNRQALLLLSVTILGVILVAVLFSRRLSVPLVRLTEATDELSRGNLDVELAGKDRGDEIGELARSIGRLGTGFRAAMSRLKKAS